MNWNGFSFPNTCIISYKEKVVVFFLDLELLRYSWTMVSTWFFRMEHSQGKQVIGTTGISCLFILTHCPQACDFFSLPAGWREMGICSSKGSWMNQPFLSVQRLSSFFSRWLPTDPSCKTGLGWTFWMAALYLALVMKKCFLYVYCHHRPPHLWKQKTELILSYWIWLYLTAISSTMYMLFLFWLAYLIFACIYFACFCQILLNTSHLEQLTFCWQLFRLLYIIYLLSISIISVLKWYTYSETG